MFLFRRAKKTRKSLPAAQKRKFVHRLPLSLEVLEERILLSADNWIAGSGNWDVGSNWNLGYAPGTGDTAILNTTSAATITIQFGDSIQVQSIATGSNDTLSIAGGSVTLTSGISTLSGALSMSGSLTATGSGVSLTANGSTTVTDANLYAKNGATLSLPQMTSYQAAYNTFQADGGGSVLDISALTNVTYQSNWFIDATNGGTLKLTGLTSIGDSSIGTIVNLTDTGGGNLLLNSSITKLDSVNVTLDGAGVNVANAWTQFTDGSLTVTGGSVSLAGLKDVNASSLYAKSGGSLALPGLTSYTAYDTTFQADGAGSVLDVSALTSQTPNDTWSIEATNGGTLKLTGLKSLNGLDNQNYYITLIDTGASSLLLNGNVTSLKYVRATLDGTDAQVGSLWTAFTNGELTLTGGSQTLPKLTDVTNTTISLSGGAALDLPVLTQQGYSITLTNGTSVTIQGAETSLPVNGTSGATISVPASTGLNMILNNSGALTDTTINVGQGSTALLENGTYTGSTTFNVDQNGTVSLSFGTYTGATTFNAGQGATVNLTTYGAITTYGGTLTGSGSGNVLFSVGALSTPAGGLTLNFPGSMFQWTGGEFLAALGDVTNQGTMNLAGSNDKILDEGGTLYNYGNIIQTGSGNLSLHVNTATLVNEAGAYYLIESDSGIDSYQSVAVQNAGTIRKTAGAGASDLSISGPLSNTGTIEADSGTLYLDANSITQVSNNTLAAGTWNALSGATLQFPNGTSITTNQANLSIDGSGAKIIGLAGLNSNSGSLSLASGAGFTTAGDLSNSGSLALGVGSTLTVADNYTQTSAGTLNEQIGGTPASGQFGQVAVQKAANLDGALNVSLVNGFTPSSGQDFPVMTFASASGSFATVTGLGTSLTESLGSTSLDLVGAAPSGVDLQLTQVSAPTTATTGQSISVSWRASNSGSQAASGSWQDSVYLSTTPAITSSSILLGSVTHNGGLAAGGSYNGSWSGAVPALTPGNYYVLVQTDSLFQVPVASRTNDILAAGTGQLDVSVPVLTLGTPSNGSFTAADQDQYYQVTAPAGGSLQVSLTSAAPSGALALYVSQGTQPTPYNFQEAANLAGQLNQKLYVPVASAGTYYILVHSISGAAATAGYTLTVTQTNSLAVSGISTTSGGNAGSITLEIDGANFTPQTTATLTLAKTTLQATAIDFVSSGKLFATFNLSGAAVGSYTLSVQNAAQTAAAPSPFQVTSGGGANVVATLVGNDTVRFDRTSVMYIQYTNSGNDDAGAPLLTIIGDSGIPMGLDPNQPPSDAEVQVLGINQNGPAGVLSPGATFRIPVYYTAALDVPFDFELDVAEPSDNQALDWDAVEPEISSDVTSAANWPAVYAQLQQTFGSTWGEYIAALDHYATLLPASVGDASNPIDILQLAANQAVAAVSTSIGGVAVGTAPGVLLAGNTIAATNSTTGDVFSTTILNDGSFVFPTVTAGSYTFSVANDLIDGSPAPVTVNAGQAVTGVKVTLDPEVTLSGQVTGAGAPVAGADVSVWTTAGMVADVQSDANGNYTAIIPAGTYTLIVTAPGLARSYTNLTLAAGSQALNVALTAESAASGTVSLSDGLPIQSIDVFGVLQGSQPDPYFGATFASGNFLLDSLDPGVYDFTISAPGYNPVTISNVQVGQGQTVNLGAVQLTPVDPVANQAQVGLRNTYYASTGLIFKGAGAGSGAMQIFREYFAGQAVASPFQVLGAIPSKDYTYSPSTDPNTPVIITEQSDSTDASQFKKSETTINALQATLKKIISSGLQNLKQVQDWLNPFETKGTFPPTPQPLTLNVQDTMHKLGLDSWQTVEPKTPPADLWNYGGLNNIPGILAGGVGLNSDRIVTGTLTLSLNCNGTVTVTPNFQVQVDDHFVFAPSGNPFVKINPATWPYISLEGWDMAADVPFTVTFSGPNINPGNFKVQPPNRKPCNPQEKSDCIPAQTKDCNPKTPVKPADPNALFGPAGSGAQGFIKPTGIWSYTVDFENDGSAAAQDVTVTEQLDPHLDWSTFQLGAFGFGSVKVNVPAGLTQYQTTVAYQNTDGTSLNVNVNLNFNVQTGVLNVSFASIDPLTGQAPNGVFDGFLPPDNSSGIGEGYIEYTVQPKSGLAAGAAINGQASVVFDTNAAIQTNTVKNTIDAATPTSSVHPLPATVSSPNFTVSWSGSDVNGPGIASYTIYVSDNGGAFTPWLTNTTQTSATYSGQIGHHYSFYSVAIDPLGLTQPTPTGAQATTYVWVTQSPPPPPPPFQPPALQEPPLLALFNSFLGGVEAVDYINEIETVTDSFFGIPLLVSTFDSSGQLMSVTLFGFNVTFLFEM